MRFSVIVPTFNRPDKLQKCLNALVRMQAPNHGFEVVIVDDGSEVEMSSVTTALEDRRQLVFLRQDNQGPAAARNFGAERARGEYLAFTDDDCEPAIDWLVSLDYVMRKMPDAMVGGWTLNKLVDNRYAEASQLIIDLVYDFYNSEAGEARMLTSNNMAVPREEFMKIGGFSETFNRAGGEDREFCDRWRAEGGRLILHKRAVVLHAHALNFAKYWNQHKRYGIGAFHFQRLRWHREPGKIKTDLAFHSLLLGMVQKRLRGSSLGRCCVLLGLLGCWQIANAIGFADAYLRHSFSKPERAGVA